MRAQRASADRLELPQVRAQLDRDGPKFWRSLEELAQTPEFREYLEREFPSQLAEWNDPVGRRRFLTLMAASLALAGVTGCTRPPDEKIVPYVKAPEEIIPGRPLYYATALRRGGYALGVLVESHLGRPTKIEGNPEHPSSLGATDAQAQASILSLYDPDRSQTIMHRGQIETWDRFITAMASQRQRLLEKKGAGLRILTETVTSPTLAGQLQSFLEEMPESRWHQYEPVGRDNVRAGARLAFGKDVDAVYHFDQAEIILSLDADFLLEMPGSVRYARDFADRRRVTSGTDAMSRLYVVESTPTITGAMADHRLPLVPSLIEPLAAAIAARLGVSAAGLSRDPPAPVPENWLAALVGDLEAHRGRSLVVVDAGQPPAVHALAHAIIDTLGSGGVVVSYVEPVEARPESHLQSLSDLVRDMNDAQVETLVILGGNPVYTAPAALDFAAALQKVKQRIHWSLYDDETSFLCDWHLPAAHDLESWGDARAYDGTATILQPLIAPLYGGRTAHEMLSVLQGKPGQTAMSSVEAHWKERLGEDFGRQWRRALHDGIVPDTASPTVEVSLSMPEERAAAAAPTDGLEIEFRADPSLRDGTEANNGWLQELPKPLTKITWDNAAALSPKTAERLGLASGDLVEIALDGRTIEAPVWVMPGQSDECVSLTFGYGRTRCGRIGSGVGYSAYAIRPAAEPWFAGGAAIKPTGRSRKLATTQSHHAMEGRDIVRVTTLARLREDPDHLRRGAHGEAAQGEKPQSLYPPRDDSASIVPGRDQPAAAWGMVIDQTACIGCNACVVACQAENNIPIVGADQVARGREMHWLRIDRYYHGAEDDPLDNPETYFQPMMCVHCEQAPCEVVCPVAATVHDAEGTNNMIYNRCVGTRYCSNNCPYKVRRFNYLQYTDETSDNLKLLRNPDVTVRTRGVMEKCSYCIQRISASRIESKKQDQPIGDGEVLTACQQACPARAITFGNLKDESSQVRLLKESPLNYGVLAELGTRPRTTYLARVVNPHPELPAPQAASHSGTKANHEPERPAS